MMWSLQIIHLHVLLIHIRSQQINSAYYMPHHFLVVFITLQIKSANWHSKNIEWPIPLNVSVKGLMMQVTP